MDIADRLGALGIVDLGEGALKRAEADLRPLDRSGVPVSWPALNTDSRKSSLLKMDDLSRQTKHC